MWSEYGPGLERPYAALMAPGTKVGKFDPLLRPTCACGNVAEGSLCVQCLKRGIGDGHSPKKPDALWSMTDRELAGLVRYQTADGMHTTSSGLCGHHARGGSWCADCLRREIDRRALAANQSL